MSPIRSVALAAAPVGTATAVLGVLVEIATGFHGLMFVFVLALGFLDGCLGALRVQRSSAERYSVEKDHRGFRKRAAVPLVVVAMFVTDGILLSASQAMGMWEGVFAMGWCTLAALGWAARLELMSIYRNSVAILGRRDSFTGLQVAAEGLDSMSQAAADVVSGALEGARGAVAKRPRKPPQ